MSAIAQEVAQAVEQRPTLLLWLFDQSPSAEELRRDVARLLPQFYASVELSMPAANASDGAIPLRSAVVGVSDSPYVPSAEPSSDTSKVSDVAAGLTTADGTAERTFAAIDAALDAFASPKSPPQYLFLVIVSDEAGDDDARVDDLAAKLARTGAVVHVIGYPAVFGDGWSTSQRTEFDSSRGGRAIRQGPATRWPEHVRIATQGDRQASGAGLETGYGPFALELIARKTNGKFHQVRPAGAPTFETKTTYLAADKMRRYSPDYVSEEAYRALLAENGARRALHEAAQLPQIDVNWHPQLEFAAKDPARLATEVSAAQRQAAKLEPLLRKSFEILSAAQADRERLTGPRWQAEYDLAYGRILAAQAMIEGYNTLLGALKAGRQFERKESTRWVLVPANTSDATSQIASMLDKAQNNFRRVAKEHAGTPWATMAEGELRNRFGWQWIER